MELFCPWNNSVSKNYGCKKGWFRHYKFLLAYKLGNLRYYEKIDWKKALRLVFVCRGNICRSPYAEAKTRALGFGAISFGLNADGHSSCDPTALKIARLRGVGLKSHRSCHVDTFSIRSGDLLIGMEPWHANKLQSISNGSGVQVTLLGLWSNKPRPHIEDPYGLGDDYFHTCFSVIDSAIENILHMVELHKGLRSQ